MLWRPQIWILGLSSHSWRCYNHTKNKDSQTIASVYRCGQLISLHAENLIWASCPINCLNYHKRQIRQERRAPTVFYAIKRVIGREVLLAYPDFNAPFEIHNDASKLHICSIISQKGKPVVFYSLKMNSSQQKYTTTYKELLSIVESLKEFRNILLENQIMIYTDHKI